VVLETAVLRCSVNRAGDGAAGGRTVVRAEQMEDQESSRQ
jgi:hypothetical protein